MPKKQSPEIVRHAFVISVLVGGNSGRDIADVLAAMYPALLQHSRLRLQSGPKGSPRYLDLQLVEDVTQEAIARWFARQAEYRGRAAMQGWMRKTIDHITAEMVRRHRDALDNEPASLDEQWARG